jgi:hypothetical protein
MTRHGEFKILNGCRAESVKDFSLLWSCITYRTFLQPCISSICGQIPHYISQTRIFFTAFIIHVYTENGPKFSISLSDIHWEIAYSIFKVLVPYMSLFGSVTHYTT